MIFLFPEDLYICHNITDQIRVIPQQYNDENKQTQKIMYHQFVPDS